MRHPYRKILTWAKENGRRPRSGDARQLMTRSMTPEAVWDALEIHPPGELLEQFHHDLAEELRSLTLFDDVTPALNTLSASGVRLAVCSNLAQPYGVVVDMLLSEFDLLRCLSYQVGCIKPEAGIYDCLVASSGIPPEQIAFIGDNLVADYEGPRLFGFRAFHLVRGAESDIHTVGSLNDLAFD